MNDSFPPLIDGVSNTVLNYARQIESSGSNAVVVTPAHPQAEDSLFPFPVVRYPSVEFRMMDNYMVGIPFSPEVAKTISMQPPDLLHTHCPIMSGFMARELRQIVDAPIVLTYHTKFDVDIANLIKKRSLQTVCKKILAANISACDEVWAVSRGAGENLRDLGYEGDYVIMPNGVDFQRGRSPEENISAVVHGYDLPAGIPIYLFVGRMMWYKGIRIILDGLAKLQLNQKPFRMVFIGDGDDRKEIEMYAKTLGIEDSCIFTGAIRDRETLRAWYCKADLFLFPSSYDTNGLVVREAAACGLAAVLIKDSCAAEGVTDNRNGFLMEENAESMFQSLIQLYGNRERVRTVGETASKEIYISWADAVKTAMDRYQVVIDRYRSGRRLHAGKPMVGFVKRNSELMGSLARPLTKRRN